MRFTQKVEAEQEIKLDLKDKKIIYWLSENARLPCTEIARKTGLSKDSVNYRIKNLEKKGIIQGYVAVIDISKIGYGTYHLFIQLNKTTPDAREQIIKLLKNLPFVKVVIEFSGRYDFEIGIAAKNIDELDSFITQITEKTSHYLQESQLLVLSKTYSAKIFPETIDANSAEEKIELPRREQNQKEKLDKTDIKLLSLLAKDASLPLYKLGQETKLSADAVSYRIKNLIKMDIITGFNIRIDHTKFKLHHFHTFLKLTNMKKEIEKEFINFLCSKKSTTHIIKGLGRWDLEFESVFPSHFELHDFLKELKNKFPENISEYNSILIYKVYPINTVKYE